MRACELGSSPSSLVRISFVLSHEIHFVKKLASRTHLSQDSGSGFESNLSTPRPLYANHRRGRKIISPSPYQEEIAF